MPLDLPDQTGRTWLVTGATSGIGRELALAASAAGAHLVLPARDERKAHSLRAELDGDAATPHLDLADQSSVRECARALLDDGRPLDVLVDNAGVVTRRREQTVDGHEAMFATNVLGPFALTTLLAPLVRDRVVVVGSDSHRVATLDLDDPHFRTRRWTLPAAYAQSKLSCMLWARELQHRLHGDSRDVQVQLAHPGWALTGLQNATGNARLDRLVTAVCGLVAQSAEAGAGPLAVAATADLPQLTYTGPDGLAHMRGRPAAQTPDDRALDDAAAARLWQLAERETGVHWP